jgi:hypothetical protein
MNENKDRATEHSFDGVPHDGIEGLELRLTEMRAEEEQRRAEAEISAIIHELSLQTAREEVVSAEEELSRGLSRLASLREGEVLAGRRLYQFQDEVRAAIGRAERSLADHEGVDSRVFARRCLDQTKGDLHDAIRSARPVSEEKERLENTLTAVQADYEMLINDDADPAAVLTLITRIEEENMVDLGWVERQKLELSKLPVQPELVHSRSRAHSMSR